MADETSDIAKTIGAGKPKRGPWRWIIGFVVAVVVLYFLIGFFTQGPRTPLYETAEITRGDLEVTVVATGTLKPTNEVAVGAEISGLIDEVLVDFNDPVTVDQILARIDPEQLEATVTQREATLSQAQAGVVQAEATASEVRARRERVSQLRRSNNASQQDLDVVDAELKRAEAAIEGARAEVQVAQALLDLERSRLSRAEIRSPIDGIVLERLVEPGQTVAASFQTPELFRLAEDLRQMELVVDIDEADIGAVAMGQPASFNVDAYPGQTFDARITQIRNAPREAQGVVTYEGVLLVQNDDLALKPGMTATANIIVDQVSDTLLIPNGALRFVPRGQEAVRITLDDQGRRQGVVWVVGDTGLPESIDVAVGRSDGKHTELLESTLGEGDAVIINRALGL